MKIDRAEASYLIWFAWQIWSMKTACLNDWSLKTLKCWWRWICRLHLTWRVTWPDHCLECYTRAMMANDRNKSSWQQCLTSSEVSCRLDRLSDIFLCLASWSAMYSGLGWSPGNLELRLLRPAWCNDDTALGSLATAPSLTLFTTAVLLLLCSFFCFVCRTRLNVPKEELTNIWASWW